MVFYLDKKQRHIFWFLSFSSGADIKQREGGEDSRRYRKPRCFNKACPSKFTAKLKFEHKFNTREVGTVKGVEKSGEFAASSGKKTYTRKITG